MKIKAYILFLLLLLPIAFSFPYLCCKDRATYQYRCFRGGQCCNGFWYPSCYDFDVWIVSKSMTIGVPTILPVYVRNTGGYTDTYKLTLSQVSSPGNANVEIQSNEITVYPDATGTFTPTVLLLSSQQTIITFTVTSKASGLWRRASVTISGESMYSMPDLSLLSLLLIPVAAAIIYRKL